jgi:hypothetical protein
LRKIIFKMEAMIKEECIEVEEDSSSQPQPEASTPGAAAATG